MMAGWLAGEERLTLGAADLRAPSQRRLSLWAFDRAESRGNLMASSIRRSADEVLVVGFRSASHWQVGVRCPTRSAVLWGEAGTTKGRMFVARRGRRYRCCTHAMPCHAMQDVSIAGGDVAPQDSRLNVGAGLSVELVRRDPLTGVGAWVGSWVGGVSGRQMEPCLPMPLWTWWEPTRHPGSC